MNMLLRNLRKPVMLFSATTALLFSGYTRSNAVEDNVGCLVEERVNLRKTPSVEGEWIMTVPEGAYVQRISGDTDGYTLVSYEGLKGYVDSSCLDGAEVSADEAEEESTENITRAAIAHGDNAAETRKEGPVPELRTQGYVAPGEDRAATRSENSDHGVKLVLEKYAQSGEMMSTAASVLISEETETRAEEERTRLREQFREMQAGRPVVTPEISYKVAGAAEMRRAPLDSDGSLGVIPKGANVTVLGESEGYTMVQYDGLVGYVQQDKVMSSVDYALQTGEAMLFNLTAYCPCSICCGQYSPEVRGGEPHTATGTVPVAGRTIAVDPRVIPYGSRVSIEGLGTFIAEDCGGGITNNRIDVYFNTHEEALAFGMHQAYVTIEK